MKSSLLALALLTAVQASAEETTQGQMCATVAVTPPPAGLLHNAVLEYRRSPIAGDVWRHYLDQNGHAPDSIRSQVQFLIAGGDMHLIIERMLEDFECGRLTRRQLAASLAALVTGAQAAPKPSGLRAVSLNHVTVRVADVQRTSQFYQEFFGMPLKQHSATTHILGVGKSFFGIEQKADPVALDHYDFGIAGFDADDVIAKLKARNLKPEPGGNKESFKFRDPDGFLVQVNGPAYEGHVGS